VNLGLIGKVAIVSGASKGIGRGIALALADEGVRVGLMARGVEALDDAQSEIERRGGTAMVVSADGTDESSVMSAVKRLTDNFARLDIVVNNLGGAPRFGGFEDLEDADWLAAYDLNVMSTVRLVRHSLPWLRDSDSPRIINISSVSGLEPGVFNPHYSGTRAALLNLSKSLANTLAKDGILVNAIAPGPVRTDAWERAISDAAERTGDSPDTMSKAMEQAQALKIPLGRIGEPADVAGCVVFLASDQASWMTGTCLQVDGGKLRSIG
jgi:3-oxoacyl-[acyl-carrier protein] reductase